MIRRLYPVIITMPLFLASLMHPNIAKADFWGGDLPLLAQILTQATQEVLLLQQALSVAKGDSEVLAAANRDIQSSLIEIKAMQDFVRDTTSIGKIRNPNELLIRLKDIYGRLPNLGNISAYEFTDNVAGGGLGVDTDTHVHAAKIDSAAIAIQERAKSASPGKAQQLTAQSSAISLHALAQIERSTATEARISATSLAIQNQHEKDRAESFEQAYTAMTQPKTTEEDDFSLGNLN